MEGKGGVIKGEAGRLSGKKRMDIAPQAAWNFQDFSKREEIAFVCYVVVSER